MNRWMLTAAALAVATTAAAKLPPPQLDEAAKAKAAETAAKTAWQGKMDNYLLCKAQDRVAARYKGSQPAAAKAGSAPVAPAAPAAKAPVPTAATASQGGSTPVAAVAGTAPVIPPCADPGPFAYVPPEQKPLETAGAHSPTATAASPPSVRAPSAEMAPAKPGTATPKK